MNETVIQEIANQLGIATDQAAEFIQTYLPQYAALNVMQYGIGMFIFTLVLIVAFVIFYRNYKFNVATHKKYNGNDTYSFSDYVENSFGAVCVLSVLGFALLLWLFFVAICVPEMIGWIIYPEAQLINECLNFSK